MFDFVETQADKDKDLCKWLRENSSGFYRNCSTAAHRIETLNEKIKILEAENAKFKQDTDKPNKSVKPPPVEITP